ncbi:hypothetical protein ACFL5V_07580 [Fibrobacterota bacterium]
MSEQFAMIYQISSFRALLTLAVLFQFATGLVLWLPLFQKGFSQWSLPAAWLHALAGLIMILGVGFPLGRSIPGKNTIIADSVHYLFSHGLVTYFPGPGRLMALCLLALLVSGPVLMFGRWLPNLIITAAMYIHGAGFLVLLPVLVLSAGTALMKRKPVRHPDHEIREWQDPSLEQTYRPVFGIENDDSSRADKFLDVFGNALKHSRLGMFLDTYPISGKAKTILSRGKTLKDSLPGLTPGECLAFLYRRFFTPAGWVSGLFPGRLEVTGPDMEGLAGLFYAYQACPRCGDLEASAGNNELMARLGRFMLSETGIVPAGFTSRSFQDDDLTHVSGKDEVEKYFKDSADGLARDLSGLSGMDITFPLDKEDADVLLVPSVQDYSGQSDTFKALLVLLNASGSSWTLGRVYYDGLNYGSFFGSWFVDRILERILEKAERLSPGRIVLGGCSGFGFKDQVEGIVTANEFTLELVRSKRALFKKQKYKDGKLGLLGFCDEGCNLNDLQTSRSILTKVFGLVDTIGEPGNRRVIPDGELLDALAAQKYSVLIAPYHNTRERIKKLVSRHNLQVEVSGLYEILASAVSPKGSR